MFNSHDKLVSPGKCESTAGVYLIYFLNYYSIHVEKLRFLLQIGFQKSRETLLTDGK